MISRRLLDHKGFSLVELIIVTVIIGLVAAIAVPRLSRAAPGAREAALRADLRIMRDAIELYTAEHGGEWPALRDAGDGVGSQNGEAFRRQLTWYTADNHETAATPDATHYLGPYLRKIPALPVGKNAGNANVVTTNHFSTPGIAVNVGWEYEHYFNNLRANCSAAEVGSNGVPYYEW